MAADEPPYLTVGTDVSAKYKGAFCEAKIKKVSRVVKCKVTFKNGQGTAVVPDEHIQGTLRVGAHVEAKHPDKNQVLEAVINKLLDYSQYTVVFDDGDETTLRRTSLCLKSGRHFAESESLDQLPLTNPEHFGTPVIGSKTRRNRKTVACAAAFFAKRDDDSSEEELPLPKRQPKERRRASSASTASSASKNVDLGRVVCIEQGVPRGNKKENWFPALIVSPSAQENLRIKFDHLVRSFKDGKYFQVPKKDTKEFTRAMAAKVESPALKSAVEKALTFMDKDELPPNWDRDTLMGLNQQSEDSHDSDSDTSDDEPSEEKDRFVAQLYKFMDERGTPINRAPCIGSRDLNLYKLFKIVQKIGGYNRVTNLNQWKNVFLRLGLPNYSAASSHQTKQAYKKYLHSFEDFFRKLGCTMVSNTRHSRGRYRTDRNLMMTRNRERDTSATRGKSFSKTSKKDDEKRKTRTNLSSKDEGGEENIPIASTSGVTTGIKEPSPCSASNCSSPIVIDETKKELVKIKREISPSSVIEEKILQKDNTKKKDGKIKSDSRKSFSQDAGPDSSDDDVPLSREGSVKLEKEDTPVKKEKVKRKDSRDESGNKKVKKISGEVKDDKAKSNVPILEKKPKKEMKKLDSKDSTTFHDRKSGESDVDSSDLESSKIEKAQGRKYSDSAIGEWNKGLDSASKKPKKKKIKEGGPDGDGDDGNDGQETDLEEFALRTGGINIGDKIRVKYGHGGQHKIYEAKVLKIDEKLPKPYYVHYTGWNMRYDEWIRRSRIVENVSSSSTGKKKKSATTPKLPGQSKGPGKRGRPSLASVHSDSGSSTQSTSLSPASSTKTVSPTSSSRSRQTRSDKTNLASGLEPKKRGRRKSEAMGEARDSDNDESIISDNEDDISEKSMNDKDEEHSPEDVDDEPVNNVPSSKLPEIYSEPPLLPCAPVNIISVKLVPDVLIKVESDDDQELLMRNEDNKDPLPIKIEEILDMISPLSEDDLPVSFTPHLDLNSAKDSTVASPVNDNPITTSISPSKEALPIIVCGKSQEQGKEPVIPVLEEKTVAKDTSLNLSSATDINCSLDEDTESEDEALINLCVPKKEETLAIDTVPIEPTTQVQTIDVKEIPLSISSFEAKPTKPEIDIISISETPLTLPFPMTVALKEETKEAIISLPIPVDISPPLQEKPITIQISSLPKPSIDPVKVVEESSIISTNIVVLRQESDRVIEAKEKLKVDDSYSAKNFVVVEEPVIPALIEKKTLEAEAEEEEEDEYKFVDETIDKEEAERLKAGFSPKKEFKKKRKAQKQDAKEEIKIKPKKKKLDNFEDLSKDHKAKKIKKSKVKKRNEKSESSDANSDGKKTLVGESKTSLLASGISEKKKKEKKKKEEKKVSKNETLDSLNVSPETSLSEFLKKKKTKKNKDKLIEKKTAPDFTLLEKKPKKKKKQITVDDETEGDKSNSEMDKLKMVKKKKRKSKLKDIAQSTSTVKDAIIPPCINLSETKPKENKESPTATKKDKKSKESMVIPLTVNIKEEIDTEETEREMSFLLCEEKVPASPVALDPCPEKEDNDEENNYMEAGKLKSFSKITSALSPSTSSAFTAPNENASTTELLFSHYTSPSASNSVNITGESSANINTAPSTNRLETEITAVLDNTPPTTPESSGSLLSSTPPHEDERPVEFKLIKNPTREVPECEDTSSRSTDSSGASTSSSGVLGGLTTLGPDFPKPSYMSKRPKMDLDRHYEALPAKRRRKSGKANEPPKATTKNTMAGRPIKVERDADFTSPNTSPLKPMECSYSDSLFIDTSPPSSVLPSALTLPLLNTASTTIPNIPIRPNRPSKFNFDDPLDENTDANKRITVLQDRMTELRKTYMSLKAEVALIDRRRKKAKKKDKNSGTSAISTSKDNSNQGNGNSGSSPSLIQMSEAQTS